MLGIRLQRFLGFAVVGVAAFLAGVLIPRLRPAAAPPPAAAANVPPSVVVRPTPAQLVTTFQGVRMTPRSDTAAVEEEWIVIEIRVTADAGPVHRFDYVLSSTQGTEYGVGSMSLPDGVVHIGNLKGDVRVLVDGRLQMGSRLVDGPSYWRCTSRRPVDAES
jgi:hypothetical protein